MYFELFLSSREPAPKFRGVSNIQGFKVRNLEVGFLAMVLSFEGVEQCVKSRNSNSFLSFLDFGISGGICVLVYAALELSNV